MLAPFLFLLNQPVNRVLRMDPDSVERLAALKDKMLKVDVSGLPVTVYIHCDGDKIMFHQVPERSPDAQMRGTPYSLLQSVFSDTLPEGTQILGETETAGRFQALFKRLDVDWEEMLSKVVGDMMAHQIGNMIRDIRFQAGQFKQTANEHVQEWLREQNPSVPYRFEVDDYLSEVGEVRRAADRLEKRVERLQDRLKEIRG